MNFPKWVLIAGLQKECRAYYMAKDRCTNPNNKDYADYGGRGITFELPGFKTLMYTLGPRPEKHCLDRIDNDGPYSLENVKWSSPQESAANRRPQTAGASGHTGIYLRGKSFVVYIHGVYIGSSLSLEGAVKLKEQQ